MADLLDDAIQQALADEFGKLLADLGDNLPEGTDATGGLRGSMKITINVGRNSYTYAITMNDYYVFVDKGRRPGKFPPVQAMLDYVRNKEALKRIELPQTGPRGGKRYGDIKNFPKLQKQLAFLIGRKIAKQGFKGNDFFSKVVTEERLNEIKARVAERAGTAIIHDMTAFFKDVKLQV